MHLNQLSALVQALLSGSRTFARSPNGRGICGALFSLGRQVVYLAAWTSLLASTSHAQPLVEAGAQYPFWLAPLIFVNADQIATNSAFIKTLTYTNLGRC